jgi:hypothetical protein
MGNKPRKRLQLNKQTLRHQQLGNTAGAYVFATRHLTCTNAYAECICGPTATCNTNCTCPQTCIFPCNATNGCTIMAP